jgi:hypothetical protein
MHLRRGDARSHARTFEERDPLRAVRTVVASETPDELANARVEVVLYNNNRNVPRFARDARTSVKEYTVHTRVRHALLRDVPL